VSVHRLELALGERSYPILVGPALLDGGPELAELVAGRQVAVVSNARVDALYGDRLRRAIAKASPAACITVRLEEGEQHKDWSSLNRVFDALLAAQFDRRCLIVALGGGVVGDTAGFAAATYQRGVDFIQVPTTLLAQVDSSVGGKTAINHPRGKNMVGAFHQPRLVLADTDTLASLPPRELSAGIAEMVKHGAIADPAYLALLERDMARLRAGDAPALARAVVRSCEIKAEVVGADERESGMRAILNFGHTFGHAIEAGAGYGQWLHGEAVGAGMVMAADLSSRLGLIDEGVVSRLRDAVAAAGLPVCGPAWPAEQYVSLMSVDKKASQGIPKFVLLEALGRAVVRSAPGDLVHQTLRACSAAQ
jgi:3-dehydroquinate synthase